MYGNYYPSIHDIVHSEYSIPSPSPYLSIAWSVINGDICQGMVVVRVIVA
jgi:hypothetical protein